MATHMAQFHKHTNVYLEPEAVTTPTGGIFCNDSYYV